MSDEDHTQFLIDNCIKGDNEACIELATLHNDTTISLSYKLMFFRFTIFLFFVTILPVVIGYLLMTILNHITFGFFIMGNGLLTFTIAVAYRGWIVHLSLFKAILTILLFTGFWIGVAFLCEIVMI